MNNTTLFQNIGIAISALVAIISLIISIQSYYLRKPKLKIEIADKRSDCFFGKVIPEASTTGHVMRISGAWVNIINNSPVALKINRVYLQINREKFRIISPQNSYWDATVFYFEDEEGKLSTDGGIIEYGEQGLRVPCKIEAYDTISGCLLFQNFPANIHEKCRATICMKTAIGVIKKRVKLVEYDRNFEGEAVEIVQYLRSIESE